jgi:hypothetical protein
MKIVSFGGCLLLAAFFGFADIALPQTPEPQSNLIDDQKSRLNPAQEIKWSQMVGTWYGDQPTKSGRRYMWIDHRYNDGTYKTNFRIIDASGKRLEKTETGEWGVSGDIFFSIYKGDLHGDKVVPVDPANAHNRHAYKILRLTDDLFEYEHMDPGVKFTARKVSADFEFPE